VKRKKLLDKSTLDILLNRLSCELIENHFDFHNSVLIGLQPRGVFVLNKLVKTLKEKYLISNLKYGKLDTTFFRDDFRNKKQQPKASFSKINFNIEDKHIVLIDDVLYTGRSIRAALIAIESFGRPIKIELLTLINRRFRRHLPIQPDYVGLNVDTLQNDKVNVNLQESNKEDAVYILKDDNEANFS
tara:strand:- start:1213 stop:1773 length:561 start_codon:yes stop_codon:yes gene_type:complete